MSTPTPTPTPTSSSLTGTQHAATSGLNGNPIVCENSSRCFWESRCVGAVFCGLKDEDPSWLRCYDSEVALSPTSCNEVCQSNSFNLRCTQAASPYCRTYHYPSGVVGYRCAMARETGPLSVQHTFDGQTDRVLVTSIFGWEDFFGAGMLPTTEFSSKSTSTSTTSSTQQTTTASLAAADQGSGASVGAIVGSVIGGIAVICVFALGAFIFVYRRKRSVSMLPAGEGIEYSAVKPELEGVDIRKEPQLVGEGRMASAHEIGPGVTPNSHDGRVYEAP
ncbi:hypothetical protein B0T14DRAFT_565922 [Immersiella caudata]|uniref:Uncharacterized protein n=1 Tax=Immersiella caudata TaxID=314043 RepID=A0AA39WP59_9PEZI|nr:hypothetical protein B0T14DRAFT_565922 [Immersiella caudata]